MNKNKKKNIISIVEGNSEQQTALVETTLTEKELQAQITELAKKLDKEGSPIAEGDLWGWLDKHPEIKTFKGADYEVKW